MIAQIKPHVGDLAMSALHRRTHIRVAPDGRVTVSRPNPFGASFMAESMRFVVRTPACVAVHREYVAPQKTLVDEAIALGYSIVVFVDFAVEYIPNRGNSRASVADMLDAFLEYALGWGVVTL